MGDPEKAKARLAFLRDIPYLEITPKVIEIASEIVERQIIPLKAAEDAVHIAIASVHEVEYLVTWNCKHLANPRNWRRISDCLASFGYRASVICTPEDLVGDGE